jgi:hypothetical protein
MNERIELAGIEKKGYYRFPRLHCMYFFETVEVFGDRRFTHNGPYEVLYCKKCGVYQFNGYETKDLDSLKIYIRNMQRRNNRRTRQTF